MPRKLPWLTQGASTKNSANQEGRPAKRRRTAPESDDAFFDGTILESRKGKGKARAEIEDDFPDLPASAIREAKERLQRPERGLSSSPPPAMEELPPPNIETMHKGVDRFDLQDDEWMMVEDEFLQTAKLFTRHLHLAEYERLKELIKKKKEIARPVIASAEPSQERKMRIKAKAQFEGQRKVLKEALGSSETGDIFDHLGPPKRSTSSIAAPSSFSGHIRSAPITSKRSISDPIAKPTKSSSNASDTEDDDDLDAPFQFKWDVSSTSFVKPSIPAASQPAFVKPSVPSTSRPTFIKPSIPSTPRPPIPEPSKSKPPTSRPPRARHSRTSTFDFLDGYPSEKERSPSPKKQSTISTVRFSSPPSSASASASTTNPAQPSRANTAAVRPRRTTSLFNDDDDVPRRSEISPGHADLASRRNAERTRQKEKEVERKKSTGLDDIPTFMF